MNLRSLIRSLAVVAAFSLALQPAYAQTLRTGGAGQPPIGVRITGVIDANGNANPAVVPASIALAGDGTALASSGSTGSNVNIASVGGNAVTTTVPVSDAGGSLTVDCGGSPCATALAQGSTTSGQTGTLAMCATTTAGPTYTTAQTGPISCETAGNLRTSLNFGGVPITAFGRASPVAAGSTANNLATIAFDYCWDGTNWLLGGFSCPSSSSAASVAPVVGSLVSDVVACAAACNLYSATVTTAAVAGYLYLFNAVAAPADGAVTAGVASGNYQDCRAVAATTTLPVTYDPPERFSVGAVAVFSATACGTLTKSATPVLLKARGK